MERTSSCSDTVLQMRKINGICERSFLHREDSVLK